MFSLRLLPAFHCSIALCNTCLCVFSLCHFPSLQTATASVVLPIAWRLLADSDWSLRESGVLLLGIVALRDPSRALVEHWPHVFPALGRGFDDPHSSFRAISFWAARHCLNLALKRGVRAVLRLLFLPFLLFWFWGVLCCALLCFSGLVLLLWLSFAVLCCAELCCAMLGWVVRCCVVFCCVVCCAELCCAVLVLR